ncbi:MAG: AAA family ATPase [Rhizomicrobium sp.]|jgi:ATP-dependent Clp protease ATP-binding subunit ClpC
MTLWPSLLLIAIVAALLVAARFRSNHAPNHPWKAAAKGPLPDAVAALPAPPDSEDAIPPPTAGAAETFNQRLHRLGQKIEEFINSSAHPREMSSCPEFNEAVALFSEPGIALDVVVQYAIGTNVNLACAAFAALPEHPERDKPLATILSRLSNMWPYPQHFALLYLETVSTPPAVGAPLACAQQWWARNPILPLLYAEYFDRRAVAGDVPGFGGALDTAADASLEHIEPFLKCVMHPTSDRLLDILTRWRETRLDRRFLESFGRFWTMDDTEELLVEPQAWQEDLSLAADAVLHSPPHSVLVSGLPRIGKTSFLKLLWMRIAAQGWSVFEASGAELMAGQIYIGQLEERIRQLATQLDSRKRVAWYVSDLLQIAQSGTHKGQSASIFDQILPAIAAGRLVIFAEASPAGVSRLLQMRPSVRSLIEVYRREPMNEPEAARLAGAVAARMQDVSGLAIGSAAVDAVLHLSQHYLGANPFPGSALDLLKVSANRALAGGETQLAPDGVLATLSQLTGLPRSILDDSERINLTDVREFFTQRVVGQDEAVSAVVDRIAMLKAGLTDSSRPIGVFLFAGPTGTGKTELAKTLAEFLFGAAERMIRLDMSEFQNSDSTSKILGERGYADYSDSLIERVRKQPFCVILLDEFEKAHANVWDLFLQMFDDGRLTDANGRTADFRHSIVVLTSNLGATSHVSMGLGFLPDGSAYSEGQVMRAVGKAFRPEFVNRIDKIIVFKPLSRGFMRDILRKELNRILDRRGLRNRDWAVEWEPSAIEFLLDKGFSPDMGARPLKRAIDHHLLAPLASTLAEHRFPEGDQFLFVRSNGSAIEVEFVDPDTEDGDTAEPGEDTKLPASLPGMILNPLGDRRERESLAASGAAIVARLSSDEWHTLKEQLQGRFADPHLWTQPDRHTLFTRFSLMDRVEEAARTVERLQHRLDTGHERDGHASRAIVSRLALQLFLVEQGITDVLEDAPVDALLMVEPVFEAESQQRRRIWCDRLLKMYRSWSDHRHMQLERLAPPSGRGPDILQVSGFGAFRTLTNEAGLHVLEDESERLVARVSVVAGPVEEPAPESAYHVFAQRLSQAVQPGGIVRRYCETPAPLVRDLRAGWRSGRPDAVLGGDFDLIGRQR